MQKFFAKAAFLPDGWADDVVISVDDHGFISAVEKNAKANDAQLLDGAVIPAMPNLHSHAFQRAFAGRSEFATATQDSFWTWRKLMYEFLTDLDADKLESIATELYTEMRQAGFSQVGEFHYIHHRPDGTPYEDPAELSHAMIRAAKTAGIGITLLPVLYAYSGFGAQPPEDGQKRFLHDAQSYLALIRQLHAQYKDTPLVKIGAAFHSLRAVSPEMMLDTLTGLNDIDPAMPIHIHIAEQMKEVEDCINWSGKRPVAWLLGNAPVNQNWCLVHATHMDADETKALAQSGAVAGLCPITEANLGDGLFNLEDYIKAGGTWGIGSDSHIMINMPEELRLLEYGQRLTHRRRAIARTDDQPHVGNYLYTAALNGGAQALGVKTGRLETGYRADFLTLDITDAAAQDYILDQLIFVGNIAIKACYIGGKN
mgnify:CR=1 FL=1